MTSSLKADKKSIKIIRTQLEFYFSEGNLPHDKFMQNCISSSIHNSVFITDLLKFNKLIELGATEENILRAVSKSDILTLDPDGSGIKRKIELADLKPAESRTIYVCGISSTDTMATVDEHLRQIFGEFGVIVRVDIPKYPSSNTLRGFAFVEFLTRTAARAAMSAYKPPEQEIRKAAAWKYLSYSNNQYNHALKQMEMLGHPQKLFFDEFIGEQRKLKGHDKLLAIAKKEWSQFRTQFYEAQRVHLNEMKTLISSYQTQQAQTNICSHKLHERIKAEEVSSSSTQAVSVTISDQIIAGSVVKFNCGEGNTKRTIKATLNETNLQSDVAYIDFRDYNLSGYLRFKSRESATNFAMNCVTFESLCVLSPAHEREYIEKINDDKEMKRESQKRKNQRKKNKESDNAVGDQKKMKVE